MRRSENNNKISNMLVCAILSKFNAYLMLYLIHTHTHTTTTTTTTTSIAILNKNNVVLFCWLISGLLIRSRVHAFITTTSSPFLHASFHPSVTGFSSVRTTIQTHLCPSIHPCTKPIRFSIHESISASNHQLIPPSTPSTPSTLQPTSESIRACTHPSVHPLTHLPKLVTLSICKLITWSLCRSNREICLAIVGLLHLRYSRY